ncbi:MAG: tetratricopeptide repeat protein [Hyphomicrobiaceae bacterium]|nr:tetratricopeptide repeat protein [Hyphomicrobiaceae bacterium]
MSRLPDLAASALLLCLSTETALAQVDAIEACRRASSPEARLAACTDVIGGASYSGEEKAFAFRNRGSLRAAAGAYDAAVADLNEAARLAPDDHQAFLWRAQARLAKGDVDGALADYGEVIRLKPAHAIGYVGRGHAHLVKGNAALSIADLTQAIRLNPTGASAYNNRGLAHKAQGDLVRAVEDFTAALMLNPIYALAYNNRGYAYEAQGRTAEAIADFRSALLIDSSLVGARDGLARLAAPGALATESERLVAGGKALAEMHCKGCHAIADEGWSPNPKAPLFRTLHHRHPLQALREPLTRGIAAPHDEMPKFRLADPDIDKIVAYINSLGRGR